jgi:branched-chain amino acid transport system permease protein
MSKIRRNRHFKVFGFLALMVVLSLVPLAVESPYYLHLLIMAGMNIVLSMTFVLMLRTGLISLAIAAFWGLGAYASTLLVMRGGLSFWLALPASAVIVGIIAFIVGYLVVRNAGFGFLMLTAVIGMLVVTVFGNISWLGGYQGIDTIPPPDPIAIPFVGTIVFDSKPPFYYLMLVLLFITILAFSAMYTAWTGRAWIAIDLKPQLAEAVGVNVFRYRLLAFVIASVVAGYMGSLYAHYIGAVIPDAFDMFTTIYVHIYAILGGLQFPILGPAVGAVIMTLVPEFLRIAEEMEPIITGCLIILLIIFLPNGLMSLLGIKGSAPSGKGIIRISSALKSLFKNGK